MKIPFKIGDLLVYVLIALLTAGSFAGLYQMGAGSVQNQVSIELDGTLIGTYDIPAGDNSKEVRVDAGNGHYNVVELTSSGIFVKEANCPDQVCVKWGKITRPGQTIVCLPHKVAIKIIGNQDGEPPLDDIAS